MYLLFGFKFPFLNPRSACLLGAEMHVFTMTTDYQTGNTTDTEQEHQGTELQKGKRKLCKSQKPRDVRWLYIKRRKTRRVWE